MSGRLRSQQFVTKDEFSRLETKVDQILDRLSHRPSSRGSTYDGTHQSDTSSVHTYAEIPIFEPGSVVHPTTRPPPVGFTGQGRQGEESGPGAFSVSFELQKSMADNLNRLNQKVANLEERFFHRLTAEMTSYQSDIKKTLDNLQTSRSMDEKLSHLHQKIDKLDIRFCDRLTAQMSEFQKEIKEMLNKLHKSVESSSEDVRAVSTEIDVSMQEHISEVKKSNNDVSQIKTSVETIKNEIQKTSSSNTKFEKISTGTNEATIEMIKKHIDQSRKQAVDEIQKTIESHDEKIKMNLQDSLKQQTQNTKTHVDTKMTENTKQLKENMYQLKHEIFAFTEKECQIVRDLIEGPLPSHELYILDFYVEDFRSLIKSGVQRFSPPWHINQFKSSLQGHVWFHNNGKMSVHIDYGRHPREVGLRPRECEKLKVEAIISDGWGLLPGLEVGEVTFEPASEEEIQIKCDWGRHLGQIDCQDIVDRGYAAIEEYRTEAVLVRYVVMVLE